MLRVRVPKDCFELNNGKIFDVRWLNSEGEPRQYIMGVADGVPADVFSAEVVKLIQRHGQSGELYTVTEVPRENWIFE